MKIGGKVIGAGMWLVMLPPRAAFGFFRVACWLPGKILKGLGLYH